MIKKKIIITGGAGFVGTNLIRYLLKKTSYKIISIDNYSSGSKKNHIKNLRVNYIKSETANIFKLINLEEISAIWNSEYQVTDIMKKPFNENTIFPKKENFYKSKIKNLISRI